MRAKILVFAALGVLSIAAAGPAMALNPQPLPPGINAPYALRWHGNGGIRLPHCHGVQVGDPRKQPPIRVCN
jgi:hypothetical protein